MSAVAPMTDYYVDAHASAMARLPGAELPWLRERRRSALEEFSRLGFPTTRDEDWKYTGVRQIQNQNYRMVDKPRITVSKEALWKVSLSDFEAYRLVFVNGRFAAELSTGDDAVDGVVMRPLSRALAQGGDALEPYLGKIANASANGFAALNLAYCEDGAVIHLGRGRGVEKPIHLFYVATESDVAEAHNLRNLIVAAAGSRATVVEHYVSLGEGVSFTNAVTECALKPGASLEHYKLQQEGAKASHIATLQVAQDQESRFVSYSVSSGASLARNDINASLDAEGAVCELYGLYVANARQHVDYHTRVDHRKAQGTSREFYKGVLDGRARAVFNGLVYVHPDAQMTDAEQSNKNLLLSRNAEVDTKPQLEIYADDVKCSHGATVGQLDDRMLFYLRSRGLDEPVARGMLTYGFAHDIVERMTLDPIRSEVEDILIHKLPDAGILDPLDAS